MLAAEVAVSLAAAVCLLALAATAEIDGPPLPILSLPQLRDDQTTSGDSDPGFVAMPWEGIINMSVPLLFSSAVFMNNTFVFVGGCAVANCTILSPQMSAFDPVNQVEVPGPFPTLPLPVAGPTAFISFGLNLYMFPMCTYYFGDLSAINETYIEDNLLDIWQISMDDGTVNASYFSMPRSEARVNASCVTFGTKVYIIGGVLLNESGVYNLTDSITSFDMLTNRLRPDILSLMLPVRNAAIAADSETIYIVGGVTETGAFSRYVAAFYPTRTCSGSVKPLPYDSRLRIDPDTHAMAYGGYLVVSNYNRSFFAVYDVQERNGIKEWVTFDRRDIDGENGTDWARNLTYARYPTSVWMPINMDYNGSVLVLVKVGGVFESLQTVDVNETIVETLISQQVMVSYTNVRVPSAMLSSMRPIETQNEFTIPLGDANSTIDAECNGVNSPCSIRLSARVDCSGNAGGTQDYVQWTAGQAPAFIASSAADPVFVCFSSGVSAVTCPGRGSDNIYSVTDFFNPLAIGSEPTTKAPAHTNASTPAPSSPGGTSSVSLLLYVLGSVAAFTTVVAVLLVARLRRGVPEEGLLARASPPPINNTGGYATLHDERYKVISKIGEGAFSVVYLVVRRQDGAKFAMKHMECQSDQQRQDAIKECEIMRSLQGHPNVINLVDMFMNYEFDNNTVRQLDDPLMAPKKSRHLCLVMEYHPAGDLRKWVMKQTTHPSEAILCSIAFQVCSVLKHIHSQEPPVIHRDIKPENLLQTSGGSPHPTFLPIVVTDFGLARMQEDAFCRSAGGTLPYVAPEAFAKRYTKQCDLWSLGCVLVAVATRRVNNDNVRLMFQECTRPNFYEELQKDLKDCGYSTAFINFVMCLLVANPEERITAEAAFKLFRKKGEVVYVSSKTQPPAAALAEAARRKPPTSGSGSGSFRPTPPTSTRPQMSDDGVVSS